MKRYKLILSINVIEHDGEQIEEVITEDESVLHDLERSLRKKLIEGEYELEEIVDEKE